MNTKRTCTFLLMFVYAIFFGAPFTAGTSNSATHTPNVDIYFFYSDNCPHCHDQMGLMKALAKYNKDLTIHFHEVSHDTEIWNKFRETYQLSSSAVPRTIVGEMTFIGYSPYQKDLSYSEPYQGYLGNAEQIIKAIEKKLGHKVRLWESSKPSVEASHNLSSGWPLAIPLLYCFSYLFLSKKNVDAQHRRIWFGGLAAIVIFSAFMMIGTISEAGIQAFANRLPYPLFVVTIALCDGFNPCAFTVLIILLSLLTHAKGRRDMALVGFTFIATSAVMYFLFIMLMVLAGSYFLEQYGGIITVVLGAVVVIAGCINIKDYFFLHRGFSLGLSTKQQTEFSRKASAIVRDLKKGGGKMYLAIAATIILAVFVNIVELGCTAMLPVVYMTTLVNRFDSILKYSFWTALYAAVYVVPLFLILANFIYFFTSVRVGEETGRFLKLVAGSFMLFFGLVMIFRPGLLLLT